MLAGARCFAVQDTCVAGEHPRGARTSRDARGPHCHTYTVVLLRDGLKLTIRPSYRTRLFDSKCSYLHAYTQLWKIKHKKSKCECDGLEGYRIFVTAACAAAAASAGLAPSCAKCCFWCGLGKMATRWQRHRPSQRWLLRRWLRWLCGGGCGSWWLRWWLRRWWLRRWLRWWPRLADAPPPRQGRHLVVTTGCKWSGSERLSVAVGKRGGEGSRHSPPARGEVYMYWHGSGRRPAPAVPVHGHRGTGGAAVHHGAGLRPAPAVPVQASGLLLHAGARCAPAPCVLWSRTVC